jgi:hypothetical protein
MRPDLDPAQLTPDECFQEVAAIFAAGLLRLRDRAALASDPGQHPVPENSDTASTEPLEVSGQTSVTVHGG